MTGMRWSSDDHPYVVPCLDIRGGRANPSAWHEGRACDDPVEILDRYRCQGTEKIFLDIQDGWRDDSRFLPLLRELCSGGGALLVSVDNGRARDDHDVEAVLGAGAAAVALSTATVDSPDLVSRAVRRHGSASVLAVMNCRRAGDGWQVHVDGGRRATGIDALSWVAAWSAAGVGAILANCLEREGATEQGYDIRFTRAVVDAAGVPVIASGGCGEPAHMVSVRSRAGAAYALANTIFHRGIHSVSDAIRHCDGHR
ncbi:hypothetical protein B5D80_04505 [Micromonospora wenchangensis]|uniref:Imidazole glycerol phosphate synthase subunit HisF n=1 Tax=Micromonospora wenchangensis TaxID=1185415 RepID=A0A2D0AXR8_9ACTN|nr:HisA/HisF-related TIM barrel protein [Micromonospora wenchangensis]OWV11555.1 hypothetical protein B5D80_04505 [Micromonospora wenchangensis]